MSEASIAVGGDWYPGEYCGPPLARGEAAAVLEGLLPILQECDLALCNLEGPFVAERSPWPKIGPTHSIPEASVKGLVAAGFRMLNLGNNHVMDHGEPGLRNTLRLCREHGLRVVGAGENADEAGKVLTQHVKALRVAVLSYTEHDVGAATAQAGGANQFNLIHFLRTLERHQDEWDYLLVLLHAGTEYYPYPRPSLQELSRFMIDRGADAVIHQHSHCPGCYEKYGSGHIIYGQGNLIFDERSTRACEQEGFLVLLTARAHRDSTVTLVPYRQSESSPGVRRMTPAEEAAFLRTIEERSLAIQTPGFVEAEWRRVCREKSGYYLALLHGYGKRVRRLDQHLHLLRRLYSKKRVRMLRHLMRNESHQEALVQALSDWLGES